MKPYFETKLGKLYHGSCEDILPEIETVDLVVTDPPYNTGRDYGDFKDNLSPEKYEAWMRGVITKCLALAKNQAWVAPRYKMKLFLTLLPKSHIIVVQRGARGPFRGGWSDQFETILITGKPNKCEVDLWTNIRLKAEGYFFRENTYGYPGYTPQPIMFRCVELLSTKSALDPFFGTGTSGVVCEKLGRKWVGIELNEKYCEIAAKRIEQETQQLKLFAQKRQRLGWRELNGATHDPQGMNAP